MKTTNSNKAWNKLAGENLPKIEIRKGNVDWILELLGWKKDVRRK